MASVPDPSGPGDLPEFNQGQPGGDTSYLGNVAEAYNNGYTYDDLAAHHIDAGITTPPPRPSLDTIMSGNPITMDDLQTPGRDAINEGAGPIGEAIIAGSAGLGVGLAKEAIVGATDAIADAVVANSRASALGVQTSTDALEGHLSQADMAVNSFLDKTVGNRWVRRGLAVGFGGAAYYPSKEVMGRY